MNKTIKRMIVVVGAILAMAVGTSAFADEGAAKAAAPADMTISLESGMRITAGATITYGMFGFNAYEGRSHNGSDFRARLYNFSPSAIGVPGEIGVIGGVGMDQNKTLHRSLMTGVYGIDWRVPVTAPAVASYAKQIVTSLTVNTESSLTFGIGVGF